jgi:hypothetical protein
LDWFQKNIEKQDSPAQSLNETWLAVNEYYSDFGKTTDIETGIQKVISGAEIHLPVVACFHSPAVVCLKPANYT